MPRLSPPHDRGPRIVRGPRGLAELVPQLGGKSLRCRSCRTAHPSAATADQRALAADGVTDSVAAQGCEEQVHTAAWHGPGGCWALQNVHQLGEPPAESRQFTGEAGDTGRRCLKLDEGADGRLQQMVKSCGPEKGQVFPAHDGFGCDEQRHFSCGRPDSPTDLLPLARPWFRQLGSSHRRKPFRRTPSEPVPGGSEGTVIASAGRLRTVDSAAAGGGRTDR